MKRNIFPQPKKYVAGNLQVNKEEGNNAAFGFGVVRGFGRSGARHVAGLIEILTWPFPIWHNSYYPILPPEIPFIRAGFSEFPPEIGNQSKYPYVRDYDQDPY